MRNKIHNQPGLVESSSKHEHAQELLEIHLQLQRARFYLEDLREKGGQTLSFDTCF